MLQTMRSNLLEEDTTEISENLNTQSECTSDLTSLKSSIESAQSQYETDQRDLETATINLNTVQDQLLEAESFKTSKTNELTLLKEQRSNEKIAFEASEDEISNALNSLYNGKKILKQLIEDFSFLQNKKNNKKTLLFQFQDSMQETLVSQSGIRGLMNYFSKMLQTPEIQSDQTLIKRVIDLIDLLIAKLNEDSEKEQQAENTRVEVFEREELGLEGEISGLMSQINDLTESIRILGDSIVNLKQDEKNQSDIQKEKEEELDIKRKSCGDLQRNFEMRSQNR